MLIWPSLFRTKSDPGSRNTTSLRIRLHLLQGQRLMLRLRRSHQKLGQRRLPQTRRAGRSGPVRRTFCRLPMEIEGWKQGKAEVHQSVPLLVMAGVTTHLSTRGCGTLEMVFRGFVNGFNAGAGIPFFLFFPVSGVYVSNRICTVGPSFFPTMCLCPLPNDGWSTRFVAM